MNALTSNVAAATTGMEVATGMPLYILLPLIMAVAIASVVVILWVYRKINKNRGFQKE